MIGTLLNHYRITRVLGRGGMGEVYAADDTRLHRQVALKVLPSSVAHDLERRQRFEREAHAAAALNHPNIVTVFSIEHAGDTLFMTMELLEGRPLSQLIPPNGLPARRLLALAVPLADAVSAAHQAGIVHRDLKPDNIMVTDDDRVKVLDFGLARLKETAPADQAETALQVTAERQVVGTVAYMSPEQAEGRTVDARSDIFSLGIVLFEMATGRRPFTGETPLAVLSSIVKDSVPTLTSVNPSVPAELARIVRRCLAKEPSRRYQTSADVRNDLEALAQDLQTGHGVNVAALPPAQPRRRWREAFAWAIAALLLITTIVVIFRETTPEVSSDTFSVLPPEGATLTEGEAPQVSPDGRTVAFVATDGSGRTLLYLRDRGSLAARALAETDDVTQPFWSPDGQSLGFFAGGQLKRIAVSSGQPQTLAVAPVPRGGTWSRDGVILFTPHPEQGPHSIPAAGGSASAVPMPRGEMRWFPSFLPDGRRYLYQSPGLRGTFRGIGIGAVDGADATQVLPGGETPGYVEPGYLLFRREQSLMAQRFNLNTSRLEGAPTTIVEQVSHNPVTAQALFSASRAGALAYLGAERVWQLTWFDAAGSRLSPVGRIGSYNSLCLSSDGQRLVYDAFDPRTGNMDLWSLSLGDGAMSRLTFDPAADFYPTCAPAGDEVIFSSTRAGFPNLYRMALSAPGGEQALPKMPMAVIPTQWSRDGRYLLYAGFSAKTNWDVWLLPLDGGEPRAYAGSGDEEKNGQMSPDGRWVAYTRIHGGSEDVFVQAFPSTGATWQVSRGGGRQPQWRADGRQLLYLSLDKKIMAVDVEPSESTFVHRPPRVLVNTPAGGGVERTYQGNLYAIGANGERFLLAIAGDETLPITVALNWPSLIERAR